MNRRPWHHPAYDPLWAEIQRLGVPLAFHGGGQTYLTPDFGLEVLDRLMLWHTFSQPLGIQFVTACLCGGGVLERFPDLKVALLEGNCSWAPWFLYRLDEHWEWTGWYEAPELTMPPSEYFKRNCWISVEADEVTVPHFVETFGDERLIFSTDYPHGDSKYPHAVSTFDKLPLADDEQGPDRQHQLVGALRHPARQEDLTTPAPAREALRCRRRAEIAVATLLTRHCEARMAATSATGSRRTGPVAATSALTIVPENGKGAT